MRAIWRLPLAGLVLAAALGAAALGAFASLDRITADLRFELTNRPASGQVIFADIDSRALAAVGVWPWPRDVHARLLDTLMEAGAADVAFDIDFSARSTPASDNALRDALARAGGYAILAAFEQVDGASGERRVSSPIPELAAEAALASVNVVAGPRGTVEALVAETAGIPALPVVLSGVQPQAPLLHIDFGIDLATVDRISVADLLDGTVDTGRLFGRQVVIGASAIELRDLFAVPRYGIVPGPLLQIAGTETLRAGRALTPLGLWPAAMAALILGLGWAVFAARLRIGAAVAAAIFAVVAMEGGALALQAVAGMTLATAGFTAAVLALLGLHLGYGFAIEFMHRRRAEAQLVHLARHDAVTGLPSRRGLLERMQGTTGPILLAGITRLDLVRDTLGGEVADAALRQVAARITLLDAGVLGLVAPDTFALVMPESTTLEAVEAAGRDLRRSLRASIHVEGHEVHVDAVLASVAADADAAPELRLQRGELALRDAGSAAGGEMVRFTPDMEADVARRRQLDVALRQAIARRELTVVFQPQARLGSGEIVGVEALVRWTSPDLGPVSPAEFIPLAEETGIIVPLGRYVLTEACRTVAAWDWNGRLAVNVSATQLKLSDVAEMVADALLETGFDPARLDIEITESVLVDGPDRLAAMLDAMDALGVGVAIDDFGTGYSSLSYLSQLRFTKLKIDQSFVRRMAAGATEMAIVQTIVELAQRLGKTTVAEGIETEAQRDTLLALGCEIGQGWLIGRPVPADALAFRSRERQSRAAER